MVDGDERAEEKVFYLWKKFRCERQSRRRG
jgi:hypothetical protein